jgi:hypothetical protein
VEEWIACLLFEFNQKWLKVFLFSKKGQYHILQQDDKVVNTSMLSRRRLQRYNRNYLGRVGK